MSESNQAAFDRGHLAGEIATRLAGHDKHLTTINGSLDRIAANQEAQTLAIQKQGDAFTAKLNEVIATATAAAQTVVATAEAVRLAGEAQRTADHDVAEKSERAWTPFQRVLAVVAGVAAAVVIWATLFRGR